VFVEDALAIWPIFDDARLRPAIFYADPPYSKEHYSRFYHVLESLERYDYPEAVGVGRYRTDRFTTPLSTNTGALSAMNNLLVEIAKRDGVLVLSYPSTGLLTRDLQIDIAELLRSHFRRVRLVISWDSRHSTLGARHGSARQYVREFVWTAASAR
jgi:adenine-specific DNA-methyltransferase